MKPCSADRSTQPVSVTSRPSSTEIFVLVFDSWAATAAPDMVSAATAAAPMSLRMTPSLPLQGSSRPTAFLSSSK
jgi:hypothetical protein